jgi:hypothetical protein
VGSSHTDGVLVGTLPAVEGGQRPCDRCGTFADLSWTWSKRLCAECRERQHPALRSPRTAATLIRESFTLLPTFGWRGLPVALLPLPFTLALRSLRPEPNTGDMRKDALMDLGPSLLLAPFSGITIAVLTCVLLQVLVHGAKPDYAAAWRNVRGRLASVVALAIMLSLLDALATILLKLLGTTLVALPMALTYPVLLYEDVGVFTALRRSAYRMQGNYSALFGAWCVLGCAAFIPIIALLFWSRLEFDGAESHVVTAAFAGCSELITLPITVAAVLYYVKLPPRMLVP